MAAQNLFSSGRDMVPGDLRETTSTDILASAAPEVELPPICGPGKPDVLMTVQEPPSLDSLSCPSCGARGSPHIAYQRSNVDKWGSLFFWIYCHLCLSAFGTLTGNIVRTYASVPKENSSTARAGRQRAAGSDSSAGAVNRPVNVFDMPQTPPSRVAADTVKRFFSPKDKSARQTRVIPMVKILASGRAEQQSPREPFMDRRDNNFGTATPGSSPVNPSSSGDRREDKESGDDDDAGWELPESPLKPKRKRHDRRQLMLKVQLMSCEQQSMPFKIDNDTLRWDNLPELIRTHVQSPAVPRALEILIATNPWSPFGHADSRAIPASVQTIMARVVSGKPRSPHEVIVLPGDTSEDEPSAPKRRRNTTSNARGKDSGIAAGTRAAASGRGRARK